MRRHFPGITAALVLFVLGLALPAAAQEFRRDYTLGTDGQIRIRNVSGDVKVNGYTGSTVLVVGYKEGRDRDRVEIEDLSEGDRIDIRVRYPQSCNCDASVYFEVKVPSGINYNFEGIGSVSGNVEIDDVSGRIRAESVSGDVDVRNVNGMVSASTVSGDVNVDITSLSGSGDMKFSSVSGNVNVKAPGDLQADVDMSTVSGSLKTNFPIEIIERRYGPGRSARGRLGSGAYSLKITSVSGRVSLIRS